MAMGRVIESTFRSLNNLLEHLHQSFFFYLLMQADRFVSIGTYLPSAMLVAVNFTIMAIFLWVKSGSPNGESSNVSSTVEAGEKKTPLAIVKEGDAKALVPEATIAVRERELFLPLAVVAGSQFLGVLPLYIFNHTPEAVSHPPSPAPPPLPRDINVSQMLHPIFTAFTSINGFFPLILSALLTHYFAPTAHHYTLIKTFSLLLLGLFLSSLATLNFSLAFLVGLLSAPLTYMQPLPNRPIVKGVLAVLLSALSPTTVLVAGCWWWELGIGRVLREAAFGWDVWGMTTQVVVWCVWWPAWLVGMVLLFGNPREEKVKGAGNTIETVKT
jgi:glycosylphosphatidylinositol transamidase